VLTCPEAASARIVRWAIRDIRVRLAMKSPDLRSSLPVGIHSLQLVRRNRNLEIHHFEFDSSSVTQ